MKRQQYKLLLLVLFGVLNSIVNGQTMYVRTNSQDISTFPIETIGKLTFASGNLLVSNTTIPNATFGLVDVRKITFSAALSTVQQQVSLARAFYVYPNPVRELLQIGTNDNTLLVKQIAVISLEGRLLLQQNLPSGADKTINVSALPAGLYLCKVTSGSQTQTIKFLKK